MASTKDRDYPTFTDTYISDNLVETLIHWTLGLLACSIMGMGIFFWYFLLHPTQVLDYFTWERIHTIEVVIVSIAIFRTIYGLYNAIFRLEPGEFPILDCRM